MTERVNDEAQRMVEEIRVLKAEEVERDKALREAVRKVFHNSEEWWFSGSDDDWLTAWERIWDALHQEGDYADA